MGAGDDYLRDNDDFDVGDLGSEFGNMNLGSVASNHGSMRDYVNFFF